MKTEKEIKELRDSLRILLGKPCDCAGTNHAIPCIVGGKMMHSTMDALSWALGDNDGHQQIVDRLNEDAAKERAHR